MVVNNDMDILENTIRRSSDLLEILLLDRTRTTKRKTCNILWATDSYVGHKPKSEINIPDITGKNTRLIRPRIAKSREEQKNRTHDKAEVFTPKNVVYEMNQRIDWQLGHWPVDKDNWQDYVQEKRIEITCGEAPFIVSRYNALNGKKILKLNSRVGFLDKKLQVISEYCDVQEDWLKWAKVAYRCSYGYEWQGDSLLIARENLLYTFIDYYNAKFPDDAIILEQGTSSVHLELLKVFATIISWNIFQMDGIKYVIPMSCKHSEEVVSEAPALLKLLGEKDTVRKRVCEGCRTGNPKLHNGKKVKVMDWETGKPILFNSIFK